MKAKIAEELTRLKNTRLIDQMGRMLGVMRLAHESNEDYLIRLKKEGKHLLLLGTFKPIDESPWTLIEASKRLAHESNEDYLIRLKKEEIGLKVSISNSETERTAPISLKSEDRTNPILEAIKNL